MNDNIIRFPGNTLCDLDVNQVLDGAKDSDIDELIIIGRQKNGEYYFASTTSDACQMLWMCKKLEQELLGFDNE